ncbi:hypothetical protein AVEN_53177-1 [Araneus ventricosus]|uniref:Uncharacterized protein n=1 Tax=Araneus ventricosus TaxID=182803 RepID=A0A4Y2A955_ARAVE|nr:hypothetical protein AVEN_53177-1 [Araneus ventricosus]
MRRGRFMNITKHMNENMNRWKNIIDSIYNILPSIDLISFYRSGYALTRIIQKLILMCVLTENSSLQSGLDAGDLQTLPSSGPVFLENPQRRQPISCIGGKCDF